jgi:integrase
LVNVIVPEGNKANLFIAPIGKAENEKTEPKTIRQYYEDWIKDKKPPIVKKSRGRKYRSHFNVHILPLHGDKWMQLYGITEIREMLSDLTQRKHLTVKTAKNVMNATLRAFFRDAVSERVIEKNPFDELPKKWWPKTVTPEPDPFTEDERDRIIQYFFEKY